ncbi:efflux transporter outer membrane subunit [Povalibacter sp.]|uniref:efflux transporter outer membrane subunit n=1 Tax=Povalibacter sp. TaxID=1962978 RepID=UPI002F416D9B
MAAYKFTARPFQSRARVSPIAIATLGFVCAGCSLIPEYHRPAAPIDDRYPAGPAYVSDSRMGGTTVRAGDLGWREFLTDPRLQQLVEIALENNRDLRTSVLNVALLRAQFRIQGAGLYPQIAAFADGTSLRSPPGIGENRGSVPLRLKSTEVGISASWEIDLFGRIRSLKTAALEQYLASIQGRKAAQITLIAQVADQYLTMLANDELLEVTKRTLETAQASFNLVKLQFDTGVATELDLRQAETVVQQALANQAAQLRARAQSQNALVLLLGQTPPDSTVPTARLGEQQILADIPAGLPSELLTRRPDVLEAEALLRSANADIGAARAAFFPSITLTGSAGTASRKLHDLFSPGSAAWTWGPTVMETLFAGGANRANLDAARVSQQIGVAQYEKAIQIAFQEVADGLAARGTLDDEITALERFTAAQRRRLELAQLLYTNGNDSYLDVLTAQTDLYDAELVLVAARLQRLTNLVDLYRALGGGWLAHTGDEPAPGDAPQTAVANSTK